MKRFRKVYLEISNICNLKCSFCPGTKRAKRWMTEDEFVLLLQKLQQWTDYLYFHLMGEPLCHPLLGRFLELAGQYGFKVILTTNGMFLGKMQKMLLDSPSLHKVNISVHSFEANEATVPFEQYLADCFSFGQEAQGKKIVTFRLWNQGGADTRNEEILNYLSRYFPKPWHHESRGIRIGQKVFLEYGDKFDWPDLQNVEGSDSVFCYGLRDQIGILCDGTVVPCCLDHEGDIALGNLFWQDLDEILRSPRAINIYNGFSNRKACEPLCRRCGFVKNL